MLQRARRITSNHFIAALISVVLGICLNIIFALSGIMDNSESYKQASDILYSVSVCRGLIMYGFMAPLIEELLFRWIFCNFAYKFFAFTIFKKRKTYVMADDNINIGEKKLFRKRIIAPRQSHEPLNFAAMIFAVAISALAFGIYHGNIVQLLYAFIMGAVFAFFYIVSGDFTIPFVMHSAVNLVVYLLSVL